MCLISLPCRNPGRIGQLQLGSCSIPYADFNVEQSVAERAQQQQESKSTAMHNEQSLPVTSCDSVTREPGTQAPVATTTAAAVPRAATESSEESGYLSKCSSGKTVSQVADTQHASHKGHVGHLEIEVQPEEQQHEEAHQICRICLEPVTEPELQQASAVQLGCR